ncbi:MAG TPA: outer membrane beta-barrel protein [Candidatus Limnocylindrales bacterium]|nr:outer membrane beta-barrel protein [Candidatus Limnocylindrales bacterium]
MKGVKDLSKAGRVFLFGFLIGFLFFQDPVWGQVLFGAQVSVADDVDVGVGVRVVWDLAQYQKGLGVIGSFDYFFPGGESPFFPVATGDLSYFEVNANLTYTFETGRNIAPYVGGGLNIAHASIEFVGVEAVEASDTEVGVNFLGGVMFNLAGRLMPFAELRIEANGGEQFMVTGGILFPIR